MSQPADRNAAHCPGWLLQPQRCFASRWRGTRLRRAVDPGDLCQPSGPDGEGQARGQARNARGEPPLVAQSVTMRGSTPTKARPELVFGLVGALGTDLDPLETELRSALRNVGYDSSVIRISSLISELYARAHPDELRQEESGMGELMRKGDELRGVGGADAAVALGILRLRNQRRAAQSGEEEREGFATILRSIKRQDEVETLREVYGPRFVLIGGWATREDRVANVENRLRADHPGRDVGWYAKETATLMARDQEDETQALGQGVRAAFELADVYVSIRPGQPIGQRIARLIRLLFGAPFETPTRSEYAMFQASGAGLRSSAAGRQVGAVVVDCDGEVLVTGTNEAPKAGGGQYWAEEAPDHRDFSYGYDVNDRFKLQIVADVIARLNEAGWLTHETDVSDLDGLAQQAMNGPLRGGRIGDLLEFGRIAHAEMSAICTAARRGTALGGSVMYTTTYPCHECARLIIATGIRKVVYVDPYPKSQVQEMFRDEVSEGRSACPGTVVFEPFEGVAPRLFRQVFRMPPRPRDKTTGRYAEWDATKSKPRLLADSVIPPLEPMETYVIQEFAARLEAEGWTEPAASTT
jgi:deoxycytidylate deaminase